MDITRAERIEIIVKRRSRNGRFHNFQRYIDWKGALIRANQKEMP